MPAICPAALFGAGFDAALLGPAAVASDGTAAGFGALLANDGSCFASMHFTALHLMNSTTQSRCLVLLKELTYGSFSTSKDTHTQKHHCVQTYVAA